MALLDARLPQRRVSVLGLRRGWESGASQSPVQRQTSCSLLMDVILPEKAAVPLSGVGAGAGAGVGAGVGAGADGSAATGAGAGGLDGNSAMSASANTSASVKAVGWELDAKGRNRPRMINLQAFLDPRVRILFDTQLRCVALGGGRGLLR